ncbi:hypothetical protein GCM10020001_015390 [Nonomuraea salmonea]
MSLPHKVTGGQPGGGGHPQRLGVRAGQRQRVAVEHGDDGQQPGLDAGGQGAALLVGHEVAAVAGQPPHGSTSASLTSWPVVDLTG